MERDFLAELSASQQAPKRRKRGGLAGIWDRNKNVIRPVVSGALGLVNPALGVAAGAAMRGLDRPGRGGIGLDVGQAVRGGLEGYGAGAAASALKGGAQAAMGAKGIGRLSAFGRGATAGAEEFMRKPLLGRATAPMAEVPSAVPLPESMATSAGGAGMGGTQRGLSRVLQFIRENPEAAGMGLQAVSGIIGSQSERRIRERQEAEERRRAQNQAMFALPMYLESLRGSR